MWKQHVAIQSWKLNKYNKVEFLPKIQSDEVPYHSRINLTTLVPQVTDQKKSDMKISPLSSMCHQRNKPKCYFFPKVTTQMVL